MERLSPHEIEVIRQVENAALLRDLKSFAGWTVYRELCAARIQAMRDEYEDTDLNMDATWKAKIALSAVREFQRAMVDLVNQAQDLLEPDALKRMIERARNPESAENLTAMQEDV